MDPTSNRLRDVLAELDWKPEQLIRRINEHRIGRGATPLHVKAAYPWVRGGRPSRDVENDALAVLRLHSGRPLTLADLSWSGPRRRVGRHLDNPCEADLTDLLASIQGDPMQRRKFLANLGGVAVTGTALSLLMPGQATALPSTGGGASVSDPLLARMEDSVRALRELDDTTGSTGGLDWANTIWQGVARTITGSTYDADQAQRLFTAYVEASETYGWMLFDANMHQASQRVFQVGLKVAQQAVSDASSELDYATRNLLASAAYEQAWIGHHSEAETLLAVATRTTGRPLPARLEAVLADRSVFVAGQRQDKDTVLRAQDRAHTALARAADDGLEQPWWAEWLSDKGVEGTTGRALLAVGDADAAEPYLKHRLSRREAAYPRDQLVVTLDLARLYALSGAPDEAAAVAVEQLHAHPAVDSPRLNARMGDLAQSLAPYADSAQVRELLALTDATR